MVNINSLERDGLRQAELCPRHTMKMNTKSFSKLFVYASEKIIAAGLIYFSTVTAKTGDLPLFLTLLDQYTCPSLSLG